MSKGRLAPAAASAICAIILAAPPTDAREQARTSPYAGRWVIEANPWFDETYGARAGGGGRAGGAAGQGGRAGRAGQPPRPEIILVLDVTPSGGIAGTATGLISGRGAPGSQPQPDIEISRGQVRGDTLIFEIWRYDGHHNRLHAEARPDGSSLAVTFSRATPNGAPATYRTRAARASY
jgi:hypothetical protein